MRPLFLLPVVVFLALAGFFARGLFQDPAYIPPVLVNTPLPTFSLAALPGRDKGLSNADFAGKVVLVNVFGSWCVACADEHAYLKTLHDSHAVAIYGVDWQEKNPADGARWLAQHGDPYTLVGADPSPAFTAIALGVTGAPETFVVDKAGVIRYKQIGPITPDVWAKTLKPIIDGLEKAS